MKEPDDNDPAAVLLASIRPAAPPPRLMERLIAAVPLVPAAPQPPTRLLFLPRFAVAAAVFVAGGIGVWSAFPKVETPEIAGVPGVESKSPGAVSQRPGTKHIRQQLLGMRDLGISRDAQSRPVRLMHARWLDQETNSGGGPASPAPATRVRDEIVPVLLTTY